MSAGAALAIAVAVVFLVGLGGKAAPASFLYRDAEKTFYIDWKGNGAGTLWATYVEPYSNFRIGSETKSVTVTLQGSAVSIRVAAGPTVLGALRAGKLTLNVANGNTALGNWYGNFAFPVGSLTGYEGAVIDVERRATAIRHRAGVYAASDVADANAASTTSTLGDCILYLSGTDVSVTMHGAGASSCGGLVEPYGDLGSAGTWSTSQIGANYPGQASLVCEDANYRGTVFATVADAGGQSYGSGLCGDLSRASWYTVEGAG